jgi:transposase
MAEADKTILCGCKIKLYPRDMQAQRLDLWRRRTLALWNLLLGIERAAYSGEPFRPELGWRALWAQIEQETYAKTRHKWETGWTIQVGKNKGKLIPPMEGPEPQPPTAEQLAKIEGFERKVWEERQAQIKALDAASLADEPKLFLWDTDLMMLMARLKAVPLTSWIGDLHSHGSQMVCKDLVKALRTMIADRKKAGGRGVGFPRFKKAGAYAEGSVYFANTQIRIDHGVKGIEAKRIKFPLGVGEIACGAIAVPRGAKLMGGRVWREGEQWWFSGQFETKAPDALKKNGRAAGIKVTASVPATIYDEKGVFAYRGLAADKRHARRLELASRKEARRRDAHAAKLKKLAARKELQGKPMQKKPRLRRSGGYFEAVARIAQLQALERNQRSNLLHEISRKIVNYYDTITIEKMDVAALMKKPERGSEAPDSQKLSRFKTVRKMNRRAAMARLLGNIKYKAEWAGRVLNETHEHFPRVQMCNHCGTVYPEMSDGRPMLICDTCGKVFDRRENAAINQYKQGEIAKTATEVLGA